MNALAMERAGGSAARPLRLAAERPSFVVAVALDGPSAVALQRAYDLSRVLGAELHALHVIPAKRWLAKLRTERGPGGARVTGARLDIAADAAHHFCELMLAAPFPRANVHVREGLVADAIIDAANDLDASLILIGGGMHAVEGRGRSGRVGRNVLRHAGRPVLIARPRAASNTIVAATDFTDERFPALTRASDLGARLDAPVTFVHNIDWMVPLFMPSTIGAPASPVPGLPPDVERQVHARLRDLAEGMRGHIDTVVLNRTSSREAIREIAQLRDADLVVVGAHRRGVFGPLGGRSVAESLAASTRRSVLAVPLRRVGVDRLQ